MSVPVGGKWEGAIPPPPKQVLKVRPWRGDEAFGLVALAPDDLAPMHGYLHGQQPRLYASCLRRQVPQNGRLLDFFVDFFLGILGPARGGRQTAATTSAGYPIEIAKNMIFLPRIVVFWIFLLIFFGNFGSNPRRGR